MMKEMKNNKENIEGAILGFAVADALGVPAEFMEREDLKRTPVTDMIEGGIHNQLPGTWSDDTSMTIATIHSIIEKGIDFEDQMSRFERWLDEAEYTARGNVFDAGMTVEYAIDKHMNYQTHAVHSSYGCGFHMVTVTYAIVIILGWSTHPLSHCVTFGNTFLKMLAAPLISALL